MADTPVLYQYYTSYYSQMVRLAAAEKGFSYESIQVDHILGQTYEPDFVRLNPACEIPVLIVGQTVVCGSQNIIDHFDRLCGKGTDAEERPAVEDFRQRCLSVPMTENTYAIIRNPQLLAGARLPRATLERLSRRVDRVAVLEEKIATGPPELRPAYEAKLVRVLESEAMISTLERQQDLFRRLEVFLDETDLLLRHSRGSTSDEERWLFSGDFTNADIVLACLLARLDMLGLAGKYWDETERVFIADYYRRLKKRHSFRQECVPAIVF